MLGIQAGGQDLAALLCRDRALVRVLLGAAQDAFVIGGQDRVTESAIQQACLGPQIDRLAGGCLYQLPQSRGGGQLG